MSEPIFQAFECTNSQCRLRFSTDLSVDHFESCPKCKSPMEAVGIPYSNYQPVRSTPEADSRHISLILDNLRSTLNVGSIFRTADGVGVSHIYCCGTTPTPEHPKIRKTSLGAESLENWSYHPNALMLVENLISDGKLILALETTPDSLSLFEIPSQVYSVFQEMVLVIGNEISGVDPAIIGISNYVLNIPMNGKKTSLNVAVSTGIALYTLVNNLRSKSQQ